MVAVALSVQAAAFRRPCAVVRPGQVCNRVAQRGGKRTIRPLESGGRCTRGTVVHAEQQEGSGGFLSGSGRTIAGNVGVVAAFAVLLYYVAALAPNQTPSRDTYFIEILANLQDNDGVPLNVVLVSIFNLMGIYPIIYSALLIPSARSKNNIPVWPFVSASFGLGVFALMAYLCVWQPIEDEDISPPAPVELEEGFGKFALKALESSWLPAVLLVGGGGLLSKALLSGVPMWNAYFQYYDESRFVHVMSLDFCALTALMPFFMGWDAEKRGWEDRERGVPILSCLPIVGPAVYLILRPKTRKATSPRELL